MNELKEKHLRPGRKITDQFIIAAALSFLIMAASAIIALPIGKLLFPFFERILDDHDAAVFLNDYFSFIGIWIGMFLVVIVFRANRPMLKAIKYCKVNRAGNNLRGFLTGLALGFGVNGFCVLMSVLMGDIYLEYSGFRPLPFILFFICVFIQSSAEELTARWYLYQKLRRRYKAPWIAIFINSFVFMAMHLPNHGVTFLGLLQVFIVGILFSLFVYYYNGLWIAMAFHTAWNFTQSILFGLPNSGIVSAYSVFRLDAASAKSGLFYNVNFGVEGSIAANVILFVICILVFRKNRDKREHTDIWEAADKAAIEKAAAGNAESVQDASRNFYLQEDQMKERGTNAMKITAFNPTILTSRPDDVIRVFEDLGFERRHHDGTKEGIASDSVRLKSDGGFHIDITSTDHYPQDKTLIRMNVDDFDEGLRFLQEHGFRNALGDGVIIDAGHFKGAHMISPSGYEIMLMKHIRKEQ